MSSFNQPIETIRIDEREKRKLVDALAKSQSQQNGPKRGVRVPYTPKSVTVTITNPGGNQVYYSVIPRNLSRRGIGFLHGQFLYPESRCSINLHTREDEDVTIEGTIIRCRHLTGMVHDVAVGFNSPVDLTSFVKLTADELKVHAEEVESDIANGHIQSGQVGIGTVLLLDSFKPDSRLYRSFLERVGYECHEAGDVQEAIEVINNQKVDVAVIDVCGESESGIDRLGQVIDAGFDGPILVISVDNNEELEQSVLSAGAQKFLPKPIDVETFTDRINLMAGHGSTLIEGDLIVSSLGHDETMAPLLHEFVSESKETVGKIRSAVSSSDNDQLKLICRQLKGAGGGYGFDEITRAASEVIESLDQAASDVQAQQQAVDGLLDVLGRIRVS